MHAKVHKGMSEDSPSTSFNESSSLVDQAERDANGAALCRSVDLINKFYRVYGTNGRQLFDISSRES